MKIDCVHSHICQVWVNDIIDNDGHYSHRCRQCTFYLPRKELTQCITGYTSTVRRFLEGGIS